MGFEFFFVSRLAFASKFASDTPKFDRGESDGFIPIETDRRVPIYSKRDPAINFERR